MPEQSPTNDPCWKLTENAAGLSWNLNLAPGQSTTRSHWTRFSPMGDPPKATISDDQVTEPASGVQEAVFEVTLDAAPFGTVRLDYTTVDDSAGADDGDYKATSGQLVFKPGETSKTVTVPVLPDGQREVTEQFHVELSNGVPEAPDPPEHSAARP